MLKTVANSANLKFKNLVFFCQIRKVKIAELKLELKLKKYMIEFEFTKIKKINNI